MLRLPPACARSVTRSGCRRRASSSKLRPRRSSTAMCAGSIGARSSLPAWTGRIQTAAPAGDRFCVAAQAYRALPHGYPQRVAAARPLQLDAAPSRRSHPRLQVGVGRKDCRGNSRCARKPVMRHHDCAFTRDPGSGHFALMHDGNRVPRRRRWKPNRPLVV